jgi:uncharacterized protein YgiM (DUF1202 family)
MEKKNKRMSRNSIAYILLLALFTGACAPQNPKQLAKEIEQIGQAHISDKRLMYWNVEINMETGNPEMIGATASEPAFQALQGFANEYNIDFKLDLLPDEPFAVQPWAIVNLSVCNIRSNPRHSSELLTQALLGTPVKVFRQQGSWYLVQTPDNYFGWVDEMAIAVKNNRELSVWKKHKKVLYNKMFGFAYAGSNEESEVLGDLVLANLLTISGTNDTHYKVLFPDGREAFVKKEECILLDDWYTENLNSDKITELAMNMQGVPYLWGGTSPKMLDCSGFTKTVYYYHGVILQRDASQQTLYGELVNTKDGYHNLLPGDLVFFGRKATEDASERVTHVGLYIGNQEFIHASGMVRVNSLNAQSDIYTPYYEQAFVRARRIIDNVQGDGIEWVTDNLFYKQILPE